jgi:hypothetical protein
MEFLPGITKSDLDAFFADAPMPGNTAVSREPAFMETDLESAFEDAVERIFRWRSNRDAHRKRTAEGFSVFDFIDPDENVLSDVLRFFLNPRGSHAQGTLFLTHFLRRLFGREISAPGRVDVAREAVTYLIPNCLRRIDLLLTSSNFVVGIENKKFSGEGRKQVHDYCMHLEKYSGRAQWCLVFLTPTGVGASSIAKRIASERKKEEQLRAWSWEKDIALWLEECRDSAVPEKIRHFIEDFLAYICAYLSTHPPELDEESPR